MLWVTTGIPKEPRKTCDSGVIKLNGKACVLHTEAIYKAREDDDGELNVRTDKLKTVTGKAFKGKFITDNSIEKGTHSQIFHLVYWAYLHALYELGLGNQILQVEQTEKEAYIPIVVNSEGNNERIGRRHELDIVLASNANGTEITGVELKTWIGANAVKSNLAQWNNGIGKTCGEIISDYINKEGKRTKRRASCNSHKQFYLDRVAMYNYTEGSTVADESAADLQKAGMTTMNNISWVFESFSAKTASGGRSYGPTATHRTKIRAALARTPTPKKRSYNSLGFTNAKDALADGKKLTRASTGAVGFFTVLDEMVRQTGVIKSVAL